MIHISDFLAFHFSQTFVFKLGKCVEPPNIPLFNRRILVQNVPDSYSE